MYLCAFKARAGGIGIAECIGLVEAWAMLPPLKKNADLRAPRLLFGRLCMRYPLSFGILGVGDLQVLL